MATVDRQRFLGAPQPPDTDVLRKRWIGLSFTAAVVCLGVLCVIWSERFAAFTGMFLTLQHPVEIPFANETLEEIPWIDISWYRSGPRDIVTVLSFVFLALITATTTEDLGQKLLENYHDARQLCHIIIHLSFLALSFVHLLTCITKGHFDSWAVWNGYPLMQMPFVCKLFAVGQTAYWIQAVIYNLLFKPPNTLTIPNYEQIAFYVVLLPGVSGIFGYNLLPFFLWLAIVHYILDFVKALEELCTLQNGNDVLIISLNAVHKYVTHAEYVWLLVLTSMFCLWSETVPVLLKTMLMVAVLLWDSFSCLRFYFQAQVVNEADTARPAPRSRTNSTARRTAAGRRT